MWHDSSVSDESERPPAVYTAWNGREYPWPPPPGWGRRPDGRYWPTGHGPHAETPWFVPQHRTVLTHVASEMLPPPGLHDRHGAPPVRGRSIVALVAGALGLLAATTFVRFDILGFTVEPVDFGAGAQPEAGPEVVIDQASLDEERQLSPATIADLLEITECTNRDGATASGIARNPLEGQRAYLITVQFVVDGERQLDGFAEVVVKPGAESSFSAVSASPPVAGMVECRFGDVFRFIPD